jgi:hypothetical protein
LGGAETHGSERADVGAHEPAEPVERRGQRPGGDGVELRTVPPQLVERRAADVRPELLVEELLELQRAAPLVRIRRVERRRRELLLEGRDDRGRVAYRPAVELDHGEGDLPALGEPQSDGHVPARQSGAPPVFDALEAQAHRTFSL